MNGIRSKSSTSPPLQVQGQQQQRYYSNQFVVQEDYQQQGFVQPNYTQQSQPQYQNIPQINYADLKYSAPRMPSPGLGQQQPPNMYQQQPQQGMRPAAPFYPATGQQSMNVRQRFPNPVNQGMIYPQMIYAMNQSQFGGQQPIVMNTSMPIQQRMPAPQYNPGISTAPAAGMFQMPPQQTLSYSQTGHYGNQPLFLGTTATNQRPPSAGGTVTTGYTKPQKEKKTITIVDPNTNKDITEEILKTTSSADVSRTQDSGSRSTPVTYTEAGAGGPPTNEIAAQFAAQVAAKLYSTTTPTTNHQGGNITSHAGPTAVPHVTHAAPPAVPHVSHTGPTGPQAVPHAGPLPQAVFHGPPPPVVPHVGPTHAVPHGGPPHIAHHMGPHGVPHRAPAPVVLASSGGQATLVGAVQQPPSHFATPHDQHTAVAEPLNVADISKQTVSSLSNGGPLPSENVKTSENVQHIESSVEKLEKSHDAPEPVTVSVKAAPVVERTAHGDHSDSSRYREVTPETKREVTPEVNIVPPTPVEKEAKVEIPEQTAEQVKEVSVPKKQKTKSKLKELNKKGEQIAGTEFDAYTDTTNTPTDEKDDVPSKTVQVVEEPSVKTVVEPTVPVEPVSEPVSEPTPPTSTTESPTPPDESVPIVEIKIEDSHEQDELEEGEILDEDEGDDAEMMMPMLRYKYSEDQWSPLNLEGKKHYDREFLLQFQNDVNAIQKPAGLPDIPDIILDKPQGVGRQFSREQQPGNEGQPDFMDFTPRYMWSVSQGAGGGTRSRGMPRQPSNQKKRENQNLRQINVSISKDIELHKAKEAWKPTHIEPTKEADAGTEELYKKTRSILNKLTPQKFQTLVTQMQVLPIDSEDKLKGVIDLVFEKAISEPGFSVAYANMCRCLSMFKVPSESKPGEMVNFRAVLLTRCQREFEKDKSSEALFITKREEIDKAEEGAKKEELKQDLEYEESKAKRRSLGNIRFIGELFKLKMLTENIMHDCVFKLLRTKDPENLECLCRLLTTIGKELDVDKAKPRMDQYFNQMSKIVNDKKTVSRVRFMLQDVMDLRTNKWVPRRVDNNPKTIDQIHKEVAQEAQEKALISQQNQMAARTQGGRGGGGGGGGGRRGPPGQMGGSQDGWNTVASNRTPLKSVDRSIDPSKMKLSKQNVDESAIQLGPGGGASRFAGWGRGSTGGTTGRPSQEKEKPNTPANRFSALSRPEEESGRRYSGGVSPARSDSRGRGSGGFGRPPNLSARLSQESERERAVAAAKAIGSSQSVDGSHRERSRGRAEQERQPSPAQPSSSELKLMSPDEMEKKTKAILDEYFAVQDMKEAILCVQELSAQNHHQFVLYAINHVLERSSTARKQTGHVLHDLVKQKVISVDNYIKGLVEVLEFAEDLEIDIPKIWQYYGEMISPMIQDNSVPLSFLKQAAQPLIANNKAGVLLAEILHDASHREGHKKVAGLWTSSGLHWSDFVPKNQVEQFLKDKGLEFTNGGDSAPTTPTTGLPLKDIETKLNDLIVQKKADNEKVFDWIEGNVDEPTTKQPKFIRALMTAVCTSAIKGEKGKERLEPKEISNRNDLLQKYLDHQAETELQALYALQALITKLEHPQGILRGMFDTLYDEDIISEDAFFQWEKSEEEPDGKGSCLKQAVQFFTWLREAEDDS